MNLNDSELKSCLDVAMVTTTIIAAGKDIKNDKEEIQFISESLNNCSIDELKRVRKQLLERRDELDANEEHEESLEINKWIICSGSYLI